MLPHPIRAICFDLDNTLWDVWPVIARAEQAVHEFLTRRYPRVAAALTIDAMREARLRASTRYPQMQHDFTFLRRQVLLEQAQAFGYGEHMADEAFEVFIHARNQVELYEDVQPGLERLKRRYRLFTASNGNADLRRIGLAHHFERSVAAREVGALKPDPRVFRSVVEGTDLSVAEVLYVGDDPDTDVAGARAAGMQPVWINRTGAPWPQAVEPPLLTVRSTVELAARLDELP